MKFHKAIDTLIAKYTKLAEGKYEGYFDRQQVCYEFIDWLNDQKAACSNHDVDSAASIEQDEWTTFCDINDIDPKRKVHRKYGFDALNYDNNEDW